MKRRQISHNRIRAKVSGTVSRPRLCVFRSNKHIYAQLIDDRRGETLLAVSDLDLGKNKKIKKIQVSQKKQRESSTPDVISKKVSIAHRVGELLAQKALKKNIKQLVFDRGGYKYHGRVKALAEGARKAGLGF